jgi:hypothetical protein
MNKIAAIANGTFTGLSSLQTLYAQDSSLLSFIVIYRPTCCRALVSNRITSIPLGAFSGLSVITQM